MIQSSGRSFATLALDSIWNHHDTRCGQTKPSLADLCFLSLTSIHLSCHPLCNTRICVWCFKWVPFFSSFTGKTSTPITEHALKFILSNSLSLPFFWVIKPTLVHTGSIWMRMWIFICAKEWVVTRSCVKFMAFISLANGLKLSNQRPIYLFVQFIDALFTITIISLWKFMHKPNRLNFVRFHWETWSAYVMLTSEKWPKQSGVRYNKMTYLGEVAVLFMHK